MLEAMVDAVQAILGVVVLVAPGLAAVWALVPRLDWAKAAFLGVVVGFTVTPSVVYALNVFLGVPITPMNFALASLAVTSGFLAAALRPRLEAAWTRS